MPAQSELCIVADAIDANDVPAQGELCIVPNAFSQVDANDVPEFLVSTATQTLAQLNIEQEPHQNFYNMIFDVVKLGRPISLEEVEFKADIASFSAKVKRIRFE